jgi:phage-related protein
MNGFPFNFSRKPTKYTYKWSMTVETWEKLEIATADRTIFQPLKSR